jgi:hypothetical protein
MTTTRIIRASAACAEFVNLPRCVASFLLIVGSLGAVTSPALRANSADWLKPSPLAARPEDAQGDFQLLLAIRPEPTGFLSMQGRTRGFRLHEFVESSLPPTTLPVRLSDGGERDGWDWAGFRRLLVRALAGARKIRFERDCLCVESERFNEPGRMPGVVQDAAIATEVRARLAGEPSLRGAPLDVQCREGCVRIRGQFAHCQETARAVTVALAVEGVREIRADLPGELQREMAADR